MSWHGPLNANKPFIKKKAARISSFENEFLRIFTQIKQVKSFFFWAWLQVFSADWDTLRQIIKENCKLQAGSV